MKPVDIYNQAQNNRRATDEISFKLIGLVPLTTLLAFIGVYYKEIQCWNDWLFMVGVFGALLVFGIYRWELRNIQRCNEYVKIIEELEQNIPELGEIKKYQEPHLFGKRIGKTQAEKFIYTILVLSWLILPFMLKGENVINSQASPAEIAYLVFCILMIALLLISGATKLDKDVKK